MRWTEVLQEIRKMRFEEVYLGWSESRLHQEEAARILGVSDRTFRRQIDRYKEDGMGGLLDKRLSQASARRAPVDEVMAVTDIYRKRHLGWNVKHFHSWYLRVGGSRSYTWVKNTLQSKGLVLKSAKRGVHRKRRERSAFPGMMLHQDGSSPQWVSGKKWDLIVTMDDATNEHYSMFFVEMDDANRYLAQTYLPAYNAEFMQPAPEDGSAFVPWIGGNLDDILCQQDERTVGADNCVSFEGMKLQVPANQYRCHYVRVKVRVHRYANGELVIFHGPRKLADYDQQGKLKELKKAA
jgi:transposase